MCCENIAMSCSLISDTENLCSRGILVESDDDDDDDDASDTSQLIVSSDKLNNISGLLPGFLEKLID